MTELSPQMPQSLEAERSVLGALLYDTKAMNLSVESLRPDDFFLPAHREIFSCALNLSRNGMAVDLVTMEAELKRLGKLTLVGGTDYLIDLTGMVPTTVNIQDYIRLILEKSFSCC